MPNANRKLPLFLIHSKLLYEHLKGAVNALDNKKVDGWDAKQSVVLSRSRLGAMPNCSAESGIKTGTGFRAFAIPKNTVAFLKPGAILIPLEVYMVNSPSRPISCPEAPPAPVECGGMTPLWHGAACLLAPRARNQTKSNHPGPPFAYFAYFAVQPPPALPLSEFRGPSRWPSARTKAKNPVIVHHQGKSRQTPKNTWPLGASLELGGLALGISSPHPLCDFATPCLRVKTPASRHDQGSIKAKPPVIVHNRASSRQTPKFPWPSQPGRPEYLRAENAYWTGWCRER